MTLFDVSVGGPELTFFYRWDEVAGVYRGIGGRAVPVHVVREATESLIFDIGENMQTLAQQLADGGLTVAEWETAMMHQIKVLHTAEAAVSRGGWAQMSQSDWGFVGSEIKKQYQFLGNFASQIASGEVKFNGWFFNRVGMYAKAGRGTFEKIRRRFNASRAVAERRVLGIADHCPDCLEFAGRGWQPVGALPHIGESVCLTFCQCHFEYKNAEGKVFR